MDKVGFKESDYKTLAGQIVLAEKIAAIYEDSYGYFRVNSRSCIEKREIIDRLEKIQYVTPATLNYVVSHPEQLNRVNSNAGIKIGKCYYEPQKVLSLQNVESRDIYENRVVLGFLQRMLSDIVELQGNCKQYLEKIPNNENYSDEYVYSTYFIFEETRKSLEKGIEKLSHLFDKFTRLRRMYGDALAIKEEYVDHEPLPTGIFTSVPQYNKIFIYIRQWFKFGVYDLNKENVMLSFVKISNLYEVYLLAKFISYFKEKEYIQEYAKQYEYGSVSDNWKYRNTLCNNTFTFSKAEQKIRLCYQPVIYNKNRNDSNEIVLYRNNSIPVSDRYEKGSDYYVPDFLIEFTHGSTKNYLILDAKFSNLSNVRNRYLKDLVFKYLFSISPINSESVKSAVKGMCVVFGKCTENQQLQSVYDNEIEGNPICPFVETLPLIEGIGSDSHFNNLDKLFRKILLS